MYFAYFQLHLLCDRQGKEVEVVWACDEKRGTLRRKEGDGNESSGENGERKT